MLVMSGNDTVVVGNVHSYSFSTMHKSRSKQYERLDQCIKCKQIHQRRSSSFFFFFFFFFFPFSSSVQRLKFALRHRRSTTTSMSTAKPPRLSLLLTSIPKPPLIPSPLIIIIRISPRDTQTIHSLLRVNLFRMITIMLYMLAMNRMMMMMTMVMMRLHSLSSHFAT